MARTVGSKGKKTTKPKAEKEVVIKEKKPRGRQAGVEREPNPIINLDENYRVKMDKYQFILQEKGKTEETDSKDDEDKGWTKHTTYHGKMSDVFNAVVRRLEFDKAKKERIMVYEKYRELSLQAQKEAELMFFDVDYKKKSSDYVKG